MPNIPTLSRWNYLGYKNKQPLCSHYPPFMAGRSRVQGKPEAKRGEACPREGKPTIFTTLKTYSCHFFPLTSRVQNDLKEQAARAISGSGVTAEAALSPWEAEAGRLFKSNLGFTPSVCYATQGYTARPCLKKGKKRSREGVVVWTTMTPKDS